MERRVAVLIGAFVLLGAIIAAVLIARAGGDTDGEPVALEKPEVKIPDGPPPKELVIEDIEPGEGAAAKRGDTVTVEYVGVDYRSGEEFDESYSRPHPFEFRLGAGAVIRGWDEGIEGMREGGRRKLIIPPRLAYGKRGAPPAIGRNATLVFVVDLVEVEPAPEQ